MVRLKRAKSMFEEILDELKAQGRESQAIEWIKTFRITDREKKILIYNYMLDIPYKTISYNPNKEICIELAPENLCKLQKQAIKSSIKYLKNHIIKDL